MLQVLFELIYLFLFLADGEQEIDVLLIKVVRKHFIFDLNSEALQFFNDPDESSAPRLHALFQNVLVMLGQAVLQVFFSVFVPPNLLFQSFCLRVQYFYLFSENFILGISIFLMCSSLLSNALEMFKFFNLVLVQICQLLFIFLVNRP